MKRRKKVRDRLDGYSPDRPAKPDGVVDHWRDAAAVAAMRARVRLSRADEDNFDGFANTLTGIGDWTRDKRFGGQEHGPDLALHLFANVTAESRWRGFDLGKKIVECVPDEMTREGFSITVQPDEDDADRADAFGMMPPGLDPTLPPAPPADRPKPIEVDDTGIEIAEAIEGKLEELGADEALHEALCYERAYGGGAILIGADDGEEDLSQPLDEGAIREVRHLTPLSGGWDGELVAWSYYNDQTAPKYGMPEVYMMRNLGVPLAKIPAPGSSPALKPVVPGTPSDYGTTIRWVHETRLLVFPGQAASRRARAQMRGWGDSIFTSVDEVLRDYSQTWAGVANLMTDFSQSILSVQDLLQMMGANNKPGSTTSLTKRAMALQLTRSISRMMIIDKNEDFTRETASVSGLAELLEQFALRLAAAADMPVALLMGQAPAGLNATGASDVRFFYDRIAAKQRRRLLPQLRRLIRLVMLSEEGPTSGVELTKWSVTFNPLYQLTALERADLRLKDTQADQIDIANGVLTPEEVAASKYGGAEYSSDRVIDFEGRQAMAAQDEKDKADRQKAILEKAKEAPPPEPPPAPGQPPAPPPAKKDAVGEPAVAPVQQGTSYSCGAAALLFVLRRYALDRGMSESDLFGPLGTTAANGTAPEAIARVANEMGVPAVWRQPTDPMSVGLQLAQGKPVILDIQETDGPVKPGLPDGHYVVAVSAGLDGVTIMNPSTGRYELVDPNDLLRRWVDVEGAQGAIFFG